VNLARRDLCGVLSNGHSYRDRRSWAISQAAITAPVVVAGQIDVLPFQRCEMYEQRLGDHLPAVAHGLNSPAPGKNRVPNNDWGHEQI
jgi:hypothetical protein